VSASLGAMAEAVAESGIRSTAPACIRFMLPSKALDLPDRRPPSSCVCRRRRCLTAFRQFGESVIATLNEPGTGSRSQRSYPHSHERGAGRQAKLAALILRSSRQKGGGSGQQAAGARLIDPSVGRADHGRGHRRSTRLAPSRGIERRIQQNRVLAHELPRAQVTQRVGVTKGSVMASREESLMTLRPSAGGAPDGRVIPA